MGSFGAMDLAVLAVDVTGLLVLATLFALVVGFAIERRVQRAGRKVLDMPLRRGQLRHEAIGTALFHLVFIPPFVWALHTGAIRFDGGWLANLLGFGVAWYGFVLFYYFFHRAMHHRRLFWMHRWHHESVVTTPMSGLSMHPAEAIGWTFAMLGPAIVLSHFHLLGAAGWLFFLGVHWIGNIVGHANAELFPMRSTRLSTLTMSNPISYHSLHHARFEGHYGFVVATMDWLFGTEFPDWLAVHERVLAGKPLSSAREKIPVAEATR
jgi:sterol desaturase/sphingolipid hydroxylase (fatty acid hydroxylase superfamily)